MPLIFIHMPKKTIEQKRGLVRDITQAVVKNLQVDPDVVRIEISETAPENLSRGGKLAADR